MSEFPAKPPWWMRRTTGETNYEWMSRIGLPWGDNRMSFQECNDLRIAARDECKKYRHLYEDRSEFKLRLITAIGIAVIFFAAGLGVGVWAL